MADLLTTANATNKLYKHTGFSATITTSLTITGTVCGVVWKDPDLYWGLGFVSVKKGTGFSATVASSVAVGTVDLDFADTDLISVGDGNKVTKYTGFSATVSASFTNNLGNRGIAWDGTNVMTANNSVAKIRLHSGFSATVSNSFASGLLPKGISWDGTNLISTQGNNKYRLHSGFSSTISSSFAVETGNTDPYGIDWDGFPVVATATTTAPLKRNVWW